MIETMRDGELLLKEPISVSWVIPVRRSDRGKLEVLMARRVGGIVDNELTFPGGKKRVDETPLEAAVREIREEIGIGIMPDMLVPADIGKNKFYWRGKLYEASTYVVFVDEAFGDEGIFPREPSKHKSWEWYGMKGIMQAVMNGELSHTVLTHDLWIDLVTEAYYAEQFQDRYREDRVPAGFLNGCRNIIYEAHLEHFRRGFCK